MGNFDKKPIISFDDDELDEDIFETPTVTKPTIGVPKFKKSIIKKTNSKSTNRLKRTFQDDDIEDDNETKTNETEIETNKTPNAHSETESKEIDEDAKINYEKIQRLRKFEKLHNDNNVHSDIDIIESDHEENNPVIINDTDDFINDVDDLKKSPPTIQSSKLKPFTIDRPIINENNIIPKFEDNFFKEKETKLNLLNEYGEEDNLEDDVKKPSNDIDDIDEINVDEYTESNVNNNTALGIVSDKKKSMTISQDMYDLELSSDNDNDDSDNDKDGEDVINENFMNVKIDTKSIPTIDEFMIELVDSIDKLKVSIHDDEEELIQVESNLQDIEKTKQNLLSRLV